MSVLLFVFFSLSSKLSHCLSKSLVIISHWLTHCWASVHILSLHQSVSPTHFSPSLAFHLYLHPAAQYWKSNLRFSGLSSLLLRLQKIFLWRCYTGHQISPWMIMWSRVLCWASEVKVAQSCLTLCDYNLYSPWHSPGQNAWVGSLSFLRGIFPTQGLNPGLLHCRQILYQLIHKNNACW